MPRIEALETLFKAVVTKRSLKMPANKAPGLGTYYRMIRDGGVFDRATIDALDKFCHQRNQVVHDEVAYAVPNIRQAAVTCLEVLEVLQNAYPL